ncbi:hypothetical protein NDU88_007340 [Pleurodeles waltl]|uniref:Uncharacterized protein n=1 Tax=Pleurodeles waltl TaxID=8319 RepID=A0AAV7UPA7_PLEWA|nr:hypothetical protein NDU88_007340 [Pleurodeles waltl]
MAFGPGGGAELAAAAPELGRGRLPRLKLAASATPGARLKLPQSATTIPASWYYVGSVSLPQLTMAVAVDVIVIELDEIIAEADTAVPERRIPLLGGSGVAALL